MSNFIAHGITLRGGRSMVEQFTWLLGSLVNAMGLSGSRHTGGQHGADNNIEARYMQEDIER